MDTTINPKYLKINMFQFIITRNPYRIQSNIAKNIFHIVRIFFTK